MTNCTLIGRYADCDPNSNGTLVFGDYTYAEVNERVKVGNQLMGKIIPPEVQVFIYTNPILITQIIRKNRWHELIKSPIASYDWFIEKL